MKIMNPAAARAVVAERRGADKPRKRRNQNTATVYTNPTTGERGTAAYFAGELGITSVAFRLRAAKFGDSDPRLFRPRARKSIPLTHPQTGETLSRAEWAEKLCCGLGALQSRIRQYGASDIRTFSYGRKRRDK